MQVKIGAKTIQVEQCTSYLSRAIGLMFSPNARPLLFIFSKEGKYPLHMWFVFFPIDVVFLDKEKKIVELKQGFLPFTLYAPKKKAKYILELPQGSIRKFKIKIGTKVKFG